MNSAEKHDANVRLCRAVQRHPCLYDRADEKYDNREAYDFVWKEVAEECEDTASACKQRWRNIRKAFKRSMAGGPRKRKPNRTQKYYLHDVLEFFIPHINNSPEAEHVRESDDETDSVNTRRSSTISDIKAKADENPRADDFNEDLRTEENGEKIMLEEHKIKNEGEKNVGKNKVDEEVIGEKNEEITKNVILEENGAKPAKRILPPRRKTMYKDREELTLEEDKIEEPRSSRRSQPSKTKVDSKIYTEGEKQQNTIETKSNKKTQSSKSKISTFYISPKDSDAGTFFIRKNNGTSETNGEVLSREEAAAYDEKDESNAMMKSKNESKEYSKVGQFDESNETEESTTTQQNGERFRFKRACKRGLDKSMLDQLRLRHKEPEFKRIKDSAERMKSIAKATLELAESMKNPKKETNRSMFALQVQPTEIEMQLCPATGLFSAKQALPTASSSVSSSINLLPARAITLEPQTAETALARMHQSVQCNLQAISTDDQFLSTLKPYLNEMNARQKLHFKKKIFESLMEVFDSGMDFPAGASKPNAAVAPPTIVPEQLKTVNSEEVRLVRELVALVQAAKQTPELNLSTGSTIDSVTELVGEKPTTHLPSVSVAVSVSPTVSVAVSASQPPPLTLRTVSAINASVQSITTPHGSNIPGKSRLVSIGSTSPAVTFSTSMANTPQPTSASTPISTSTAGSTPTVVQRRIIRKLVKINELGQPTYELSAPSTVKTSPPPAGEGLRRRILRIFPKSSLSSSSLDNAVTSSGIGTYTTPRSTNVTSNVGSQGIKILSAPTISNTVSSSVSSTGVQNLRQFVTPVSTIGWTTTTTGSSTSTANSITASSVANRAVGVSGARPIVRRYSVCGSLPNFTVERHTGSNYLTTTATTKPISSTPQNTLSYNLKEFFKQPTPVRSATTTTTTQGTVVVTNTTSSRKIPVLSVSASDRNTSARTLPITVGFNKFARNDGLANGSAQLSSKQSSYHKNSTSRQSPISLNNNSMNFNAPLPSSTHLGSGLKRLLEMSPDSSEKRICTNGVQSNNGEAASVDMAGIIGSDDFSAVSVKSEPIEDDY